MSIEQQQVVVGFDFSESAQFALERAVGLASRAPFHVLQFVCVLDPRTGVAGLPVPKKVDFAYTDKVREELAAAVARELRAAGAKARITYHIHVRFARNPAKEILAVAKEVGADLIVLGSHGRKGIDRAVLGSVSEKVVRAAKCAVVIARPKEYPYVALLEVVEVQPHHHVRSSRHIYDGEVGTVGPLNWPGA